MGTGYAQPADSALPLMPYVLGAAAGVVGAGAAVAGIVALTHGRREQVTGEPPVASATLAGAGGPAGGRGGHASAPAGEHAGASAGEDAIALALAELGQPTPAAPAAAPAPAAHAAEPTPAAPQASSAPRPDSTEAFLAVLAGNPAPATSAPAPTPAPEAHAADAASPSDTIARLAPLADAPAAPSPAVVTPAADAAPAPSAGDTAAFIALLGAQGKGAASPTDDDDPRPPHGGAPAPTAPEAADALPGVSKADMPASAPASTRDASGLDAWSADPVPPSAEEGADPLADACDWRAIALAELEAPAPQGEKKADERTVSQTLPRAASSASATHAEYVAPVVGPTPAPRFVSALRESGRLEEVQEALLQAVSAHEAAKAQAAPSLDALPEVEPSCAPAAPEPTSAFVPPAHVAGEDLTQAASSPAFVPTARHFASEAAHRAQAPVAAVAAAASADDGWDDGFDEEFSAFASASGVPQIQRGQAARVPAHVSCVVPDVGDDEFCDDPAAAWPAPAPVSGFGYAPVSPAQRLQASLAPSAAGFAARAARQAQRQAPAYAWPAAPAPAYGYGYAPTPVPQPVTSQPAYACAAPAPAGWAQPRQAYAWPQQLAYAPAYAAPQTSIAAAVPPVRAAGEQLPSTDAVTYADDVYRTDTLSPEYISYLVDDEFAHRHDSPAQRAAAAGRMHVVMGSGKPARTSERKPGAKHFA